ncbi:hypothetical protein EW146_g3790 [Bondarzewia mesenterica]|uniref:Uncharacterized protein n=1 Tax=Bondarzewia mesenterica TaxID=1095465 RepID=A0A4S4LX02_9AGAM|nr:hypothetical protein EW146_g3790 [Bondarzewia mesenterica]
MSQDYDSSDILGNSVPLGRGRAASNSAFSSFFSFCILGAACLMVFLIFRNGRTVFLRWKERHYKLSMRRRYGIPDHDQRPFNVAYAAARLAQEDARNLKSRIGPENVMANGPDRADLLRAGQQQIRQRQNSARVAQMPQSTPSAAMNDFNGHGRFGTSVFVIPSGSDVSNVPSGKGRRAVADVDRLDPWEPVVGDEVIHKGSAEFPVRNTEPHDRSTFAGDEQGIPERVARRAKRSADDEQDENIELAEGSRRDKRRRKVSTHHQEDATDKVEDAEMDVDEAPKVRMIGRGTKRDREDAGSTFGGDDESVFDEHNDERPHRHRKRRQRKSGISYRGQKRGRDVDPLDSESDIDLHRTVGKAARRRQNDSTASEGDIAINDSRISKDPFCKGRRIGEEWEAHGAQFKVGLDGKRLRKVLVKTDRPKFPMPVDSEHPDRSAHVMAIVEKWYTEDEYQEAKERRELAWQDSPKVSAEPETPHEDSPIKAGKELLWGFTPTGGSPVHRSPLRHSIAPNILALSQPQTAQLGRRVTPIHITTASKPVEFGTKVRTSKSYTKWERQELEAEAMSRIRRKMEEQAKKEEAVKTVAPSLSVIQPMAKPAVATEPSSTSTAGKLAQGTAPTSGAPSGEDKGKSSTPSLPLFPIAKESVVPNVTSQKKSGFDLPGAAPSTTVAKTPFSFATPPPTSNAPSASSTIPPAPSSSSGMPNFFGSKGTGTSSPFAPATTPSAPAVSSPLAPPSTAQPRSPFAFAPPSSNTSGSTATSSLPFSFAPSSNKPLGPTPIQQNAEPPKPAAGTFTFGKPTGFNAFSSQNPSPAATPVAAIATDGSTPKPFEPAKPVSAFPSMTAPAAAASGTASAMDGAMTKPKFSFGLPKAPTSASGASTVTSEPKDTGSKSVFGSSGQGASNPFLAPNNGTTSFAVFGSAGGSKPTEPAKPPISFSFGGSSNATGKQPEPVKNPFMPSNNTSSTTGSMSNPAEASKPVSAFGFAAPAPPSSASATKPLFSFAAPPQPQSSVAPASERGKSPFSFGGLSQSSATPQTSNPLPFGFGSATQNAMHTQADGPSNPTPAPSPFGTSSGVQPGIFGFGKPTTGSSVFGSNAKPS